MRGLRENGIILQICDDGGEKVITTVCLNPSFDKTVHVDTIRIGQVNRLRNGRVDLGGKGINVAVVARRLGLDVECLGLMGEESASELSGMMDREMLKHTFLTVPGRVRTNLKICTQDGQGITELNETGDPISPDCVKQFVQLAQEKTKNSDLVVLTGSLPPGCPEGTYRDLMLAIPDKKIILDTEGRELELCAKGAKPFLIKPNLREMEATLGIELRTMRAIRDAALLFIRLGVEHAIVSMGAMGAMYVSQEKTLFSAALRVEARSTVGAGDAMIGGILLGYEKEKDMARAFRYGVAAGAASVMTEGTQLIVPSEFERLLEQVRVQEV